MTKITKSTFKSFVRKNEGNLFVKKESSFDGMTDCVQTNNNAAFRPATKYEPRAFTSTEINQNTLGYNGIWLVGGGRDYFKAFEDAEFAGFEYYNSCGNGLVAIRKAT